MFNLSDEISRLRLEISHLKEQNKHIQQHISPIYGVNNNKTAQKGKFVKQYQQQQYMNYNYGVNNSNSNNSHMYITQSLPNQKQLNSSIKRNAFPIQKGMFSMKKVKHATTTTSNRTPVIVNNSNNNNNSSLLSQGLQFLDDNESISINDNTSSNKASVSSINLNKYKIFPSSTPITTNAKVKTTLSTSNKHISPSTILTVTPPTTTRTAIATNMIEHTAHFDNKPRFIKESRRMLIEYTKTMKHITHETSLTNVLSSLKLNPIILQQKPQQQQLQQHQQPQTQINIINDDDYNNNNNVKTTMLNYLSVPRLMSLIKEDDEREAFIFLLSPTFSSFSDGKERYLFRWVDLKERLIKGGFDICNVLSCELKDEEGNVFKIEVIININEKKVYEIEASTQEMCYNYIKAINYMKNNYSKNDK